MPTLKIESDGTTIGTCVSLDGVPIRGCTRVQFEAEAGSRPARVFLELVPLDGLTIDLPACVLEALERDKQRQASTAGPGDNDEWRCYGGSEARAIIDDDLPGARDGQMLNIIAGRLGKIVVRELAEQYATLSLASQLLVMRDAGILADEEANTVTRQLTSAPAAADNAARTIAADAFRRAVEADRLRPFENAVRDVAGRVRAAVTAQGWPRENAPTDTPHGTEGPE